LKISNSIETLKEFLLDEKDFDYLNNLPPMTLEKQIKLIENI
jgi:hypothetical protein